MAISSLIHEMIAHLSFCPKVLTHKFFRSFPLHVVDTSRCDYLGSQLHQLKDQLGDTKIPNARDIFFTEFQALEDLYINE